MQVQGKANLIVSGSPLAFNFLTYWADRHDKKTKEQKFK